VGHGVRAPVQIPCGWGRLGTSNRHAVFMTYMEGGSDSVPTSQLLRRTSATVWSASSRLLRDDISWNPARVPPCGSRGNDLGHAPVLTTMETPDPRRAWTARRGPGGAVRGTRRAAGGPVQAAPAQKDNPPPSSKGPGQGGLRQYPTNPRTVPLNSKFLSIGRFSEAARNMT